MDYKPLDPQKNEIRLVNIHSETSFSDPIRVSIEHVSLNTLPPYTALSYCWGDKTDTRPILLGNGVFPITVNLYNALQHIRAKGIMRLWVDAICINQSDVEEKNRQILLMRSIYQCAKEVIAWVGVEDETSNDAILDELASNAQSFSTSASQRARLAVFMQREYWMRVWIIQEIASATTLTIKCGQQQIGWPKVRAAFVNFVKRKGYLTVACPPWYRHIESLVYMRNSISESTENLTVPLLDTLYLTWMAKASDPQDKIYGILGIATDGPKYMPAPNYSSTIEQVCLELTLRSIIVRRNLDFIPLLGRGCRDASVISGESPSWLPRWHAIDGIALERQLSYLLSLRPMSQFCAAGKSSAIATQENNVLSCRGMIVGTIHTMSRFLSNDENSQSAYVAPFAKDMPNPYGTSNETFKALLENFICRSGPKYSHIENIAASEFLRIWRSPYQAGFDEVTQAWIDEHRSFTFHGRNLESWAKQISWTVSGMNWRAASASYIADGRYTDVRRYIVPRLVYMLKHGMRLMVTNTGHIGWAHERAEVGDSLFTFKGCSVPVILRSRAEGGFVLVGDAYIEGMMRGETMDSAKDTSWVDVEIH